MNRRGIVEDLFELLFAVVLIAVVLLFCFLLKFSHSHAINVAATSYNSEIDTSYLLNNILRSSVVVDGHEGSVAEFVVLCAEEDSAWFKEVFGASFRGHLAVKVEELADSVNLGADLVVIYGGKSFVLYNSGTRLSSSGLYGGSSYRVYSDVVQLPSLRDDFVDLKVTRYVVG